MNSGGMVVDWAGCLKLVEIIHTVGIVKTIVPIINTR